MTGDPKPATEHGPIDYVAIGLAIGLVALVGVSLSLTIPLLSIEMERMGVSSLVIGLNTATGGLSNMVVVPFVPMLAARFGVRVLLLAAILVGMLSIIAFPLSPFPLWFPLRFLFGASLGTLFTLSEYWINAASPPERRGLIMGVYVTLLALGFAAGPTLLGFTGTHGWPPYLAAAALFALAMIPLALARGLAPEFDDDDESDKGVLYFLHEAPTASFAALVFGAIETGAFGLLPVYGLRIGYTEATATMLVSMIALGNVAFQIPIGWVSDYIDRRKLLFGCAFLGMVGGLIMPYAVGNLPFLQAGLFFFGGIAGSLYTVGLSHLGERYTGLDLASANATFVILYALGLIVGPPFVGAGMDMLGPHGFSMTLSFMLGAYALLVFTRMLRAPRKAKA